jgi:hypothetical protein
MQSLSDNFSFFGPLLFCLAHTYKRTRRHSRDRNASESGLESESDLKQRAKHKKVHLSIENARRPRKIFSLGLQIERERETLAGRQKLKDINNSQERERKRAGEEVRAAVCLVFVSGTMWAMQWRQTARAARAERKTSPVNNQRKGAPKKNKEIGKREGRKNTVEEGESHSERAKDDEAWRRRERESC